MSDNTMNIAGEMSAIAANNGIYTLADNALRLSTESLSTAIDNKVTIDNRLCNVIEQSDLSIVKLSASEYYDLVNSGSVVSNVVYVVENQFENAYGQQIKNLAPGTDLSDAVNLEQLNAVSANAGTITGITMNGASKGTSGNVDLGTVLTAHQSLSDYYTKSETSSAVEISAALNGKADLSAVSQVIVDGVKADISVMHMSKAEYDQTAEQGQLLSNALYIVSGDYVDVIEDTAGNKISANLCCTIAGSQNATKLATLDDITSKADTSTVTSLSNSLSSFYVKTDTSSASEISTAFQLSAGNKVFIDDRISNISEQTDLSIVKLSASEYYDLVNSGTVISNVVYVVENQFENAYGQQIKNLAPGTDLSDAVNLEQLSNALSDVATKGYVDTNFQPIGSYLTAIPVDYKTYSNTVTALTASSGFKTYSNTVTALTSTSDFKTYTQTKSTLSTDGYATTSQVNAKSTVSFNRITTSGTNIGSITIDGTTTQIYAPAGGGSGGGSSVQVSADYQTGTKVATISVDSVPTSIYIPNSSGSSRYALETAQLVSDGGSLTCAVNDQTITTIQVSSSATPVVVQLPAQPEDGARDFILRIEISSSTAPTFTFNGVNETIDFDSEDDDWAVMEPGLNLVSFTETKRGN